MSTTINGALLGTGAVIQVARQVFTAVATTTGVIPYDDSIPQNTEGGEFMTISFTPKQANSLLIIEAYANLNCGNSGNEGPPTGALFKNSDVSAFAASQGSTPFGGSSSQLNQLYVRGFEVISSTAPITYRFRAGGTSGVTHTFNGSSGVRRYGGVSASFIMVTEVAV